MSTRLVDDAGLPDIDRDRAVWEVLCGAGGTREHNGRLLTIKVDVDRFRKLGLPPWFTDDAGYPPAWAAYFVLDLFQRHGPGTARDAAIWLLIMWMVKGDYPCRNPHFGAAR